MSTPSQCTLNQILFQDMPSHHHHRHHHHHHQQQQQLDFFCVSSSSTTINIASATATATALPFESPRTLIPAEPLPSRVVVHQSSYDYNNIHHHHHQRDDNLTSLFSQHTSIPNMWEWEEVNNERRKRRRRCREDSEMMGVMKKKTRKKVREPRFSFKTMSDVDVLDDGYKWRKYGQKVVKNTHHPRSYYRCTQDNCRVKKRVERLVEDPRMVITTYEGRHVHSPSRDEDDDDSQPSSQYINHLLW